ncbi:MAG: ABC transporter substrate-binding protein [Alphaproteobacteria bacterium]|nr:ABC transporter substrate-binding protein [Rhizobiaceae bacterium]MBC7150646.1 ABC transporter substrate-binding protein [Rhizobium sp.]MBU3963357.1 ABC transporter substrate-binding protein [Alphaproteobacteria bacterium]MBU4052457.1 ABC transporter substrate-binding protein [Alphaproteobacteria bacterium]MBU4090195.1 ABC transporter substrate-binding protein [Alphaproteobacteria bacterium]
MSDHTKYLSSRVTAGAMNRREFMGRAMAAGLTLTAASTLYAASASAQEPKRGGNLRLGLEGGAATDSKDPAKFLSQFMFCVGRCWGDMLVESDPLTGAAVPALAESWEPSADAATWTFTIRKGVQFHDGKTLTVDDVIATLKRHTDEKSESGALGVMKSIKEIKKDGDKLVLALTEGNADLPLLLSDYHLVIQPNGGNDDPLASIGTGPYKLVTFEPGVRATLEKNPNDWRSDRGYVDTIEILGMNDATARIAALASGQVHYINRVDPKTVDMLKRAPNVEILSTSGRGHYVFIMHCNTAPFDNNDLRLALKYAMNREAMVQTVLGGYGKVGNDFPINSTYALFPEGIEQRAYDPDKAAFHYKKSGHSGPVLLRTSEVAFPGAVDAAVLYQGSAQKAGIDIEVKREPGDGYWSNVWNVQPFSTSYWGGRPTQDQMYSTAYLSTADWNDTRFLRPDFDKILLEARSELDEAKRKEMYRDMAMMVRDEGGLILPMFNDFVNAAQKSVKGYVHDIGNDMSNGYVATRVWLDA